MNKTYFNYLLKSKRSLCVVVIVLYALGFAVSMISFNSGDGRYLLNITIASVLLALFTFILVPLEFKFVHNKKAVDTYFALPITRKEILVTTLVFICLLDLVPFMVSSLVSVIIGVVVSGIQSYPALFVYLVVAIVSAIVFICFITSLFLEANSTFDGIVMIFAYLIMPAFVALLLDTFQYDLIAGVDPLNVEQIISFISLPTAVVNYEFNLGDCFASVSCDYQIASTELVAFLICILLHTIFSLVALKRNFTERKVERAESISNRFLSYPFVIYFYATILIFTISASFNTYNSYSSMAIYYALIFVCFLVATFVYRRKVKIVMKDVIFFVVTILITIGISVLAYATKGFNLAYKYNHNPESYAYRYFDSAIDRSVNKDIEYFGNRHEPDQKLLASIKKKYPNVYEYYVSFDQMITKEEMDKNKDAITFIEELRTDAIDNYYDRNSKETSHLEIVSNFYQNDYYYYNFYGLNTKDSKDKATYNTVRSLTFDELVKINEKAPVHIDVFATDGMGEEILLSEILD